MTGRTPGTSVSQFLTAARKVLLQLLSPASSMCRTPSMGLCCCCRVHQQYTWEASTVGTTGTRSLPLVELHCLLRQSSQQVGLVHLHRADVQHGQVSLQFLQQGATASIPEHGRIRCLIASTHKDAAILLWALENGILGQQLASGSSIESLNRVRRAHHIFRGLCQWAAGQLHQDTTHTRVAFTGPVRRQAVPRGGLCPNIDASPWLQQQVMRPVGVPSLLFPETGSFQGPSQYATIWQRGRGHSRQIRQRYHGTPGLLRD